ncbi:unnamed protein product [Thlaspi arvense]|uniref:Replication protein A 70 kDa DNA-binding subunit B/D first OB fold domain-containing protein n=1 Tax=Thlaspi arvense TaxID=13288 RepID=A0AAU9T4M1_THLAR|nr:unnamed protein product [Thlaspi arvense]
MLVRKFIHLKRYEKHLSAGNWKFIEEFNVSHSIGQNMTTKHCYRISFVKDTIVTNSVTVSKSDYLDLVPYNQIHNGKHPQSILCGTNLVILNPPGAEIQDFLNGLPDDGLALTLLETKPKKEIVAKTDDYWTITPTSKRKDDTISEVFEDQHSANKKQCLGPLTMDGIFHNIRNLNQWRSNWYIRIMVFKSWESQSQGESEVLNFIFVDEEGDKIHAICDDIQNQPYYRTKLIVVNRLVDCMWKIRLLDNTDVRKEYDVTDEHYMKFTSFDDVLAGRFNRVLPVHVLGRISMLTDIVKVKDSDFGHVCHANTCSLKFAIQNTQGTNLSCVVHEKLALQITKKWWNFNSNNMVVILSDFRVVNVGENIRLIDAGEVPTVLYDPDISEARRFKRASNGNDEDSE